jgi:hypothetical protein
MAAEKLTAEVVELTKAMERGDSEVYEEPGEREAMKLNVGMYCVGEAAEGTS